MHTTSSMVDRHSFGDMLRHWVPVGSHVAWKRFLIFFFSSKRPNYVQLWHERSIVHWKCCNMTSSSSQPPSWENASKPIVTYNQHRHKYPTRTGLRRFPSIPCPAVIDLLHSWRKKQNKGWRWFSATMCPLKPGTHQREKEHFCAFGAQKLLWKYRKHSCQLRQ